MFFKNLREKLKPRVLKKRKFWFLNVCPIFKYCEKISKYLLPVIFQRQ